MSSYLVDEQKQSMKKWFFVIFGEHPQPKFCVTKNVQEKRQASWRIRILFRKAKNIILWSSNLTWCLWARKERHLCSDIFGFASLACQRFKSQSTQSLFQKGQTCKHNSEWSPRWKDYDQNMFCVILFKNKCANTTPKVWFAVLKRTLKEFDQWSTL